MNVDELKTKRSALSFQISEIKYAIRELECQPLAILTKRSNRIDFSLGFITALGEEIDRISREIDAIDAQLKRNDRDN